MPFASLSARRPSLRAPGCRVAGGVPSDRTALAPGPLSAQAAVEFPPPSLSARVAKRTSTSPRLQKLVARANGGQPAEPGARAPSDGTIADIWTRAARSDGAKKSISYEADRNLFLELQKNAEAKREADQAQDAAQRAQAADETPPKHAPKNAFMESINSAPQAPRAPSAPLSSAPSRRSEDEEIRADRQRRMAEQGLVEGGSMWRTGTATPAEDAPDGAPAESAAASSPGPGAAGPSKDMSPEQFTLAKEQQLREQGADVISTDRTYKPAVATWGVYQRPANISKTYGGGRPLTPADTSMSDAEKAAYERSLQDKLQAFRRKAGLVVDPAKVRECEELTSQGLELLVKGQLAPALVFFDKASVLASPKTEAGGQALLQKAITLDSMGESDEAFKLYSQLKSHNSVQIRKKARSMSFGFTAGEFLKAGQISYAARKEDLDPYFNALGGKWGWNTVYAASSEDKEEDRWNNAVLSVVVAAMTLSPFGILLYVVVAP